MIFVLATKNRDKENEFRALFSGLDVELRFLGDYPGAADVVEDGSTFEENALKKARYAHELTGEWALADDSGLEVEALGGAPGIYSSRYAGRKGDYDANNRKLMEELKEVPQGKRGARFVSVIAIVGGGNEYVVRGICEGEIAFEPRGKNGFGYDPIFYIPSLGKTMAELEPHVKNEISHRGNAFKRARKLLLEILKDSG